MTATDPKLMRYVERNTIVEDLRSHVDWIISTSSEHKVLQISQGGVASTMQ